MSAAGSPELLAVMFLCHRLDVGRMQSVSAASERTADDPLSSLARRSRSHMRSADGIGEEWARDLPDRSAASLWSWCSSKQEKSLSETELRCSSSKGFVFE